MAAIALENNKGSVTGTHIMVQILILFVVWEVTEISVVLCRWLVSIFNLVPWVSHIGIVILYFDVGN